MGLGKGQGVLSFLKLDVFSLVNECFVYICVLYVYMSTTCVPGAGGRQKRASDPLELESRMVGGCRIF